MSGTLRLRGSTSGYSELQAPAVAADQTFILPTAGGTLLTTDSPISKLTLELGSASQPSLTFEGDTDTGLYSSGTNQLNLVTGGTNRLYIDDGGQIGINTTSPSSLLDVNGGFRSRGAAEFDANVEIGGDTQLNVEGVKLYPGGMIEVCEGFAVNSVFRGKVAGNGTLNIDLKAGGDAVFLGDVGIGTSSPSSPLTVNQSSGNINLELHSSTSGRGTQIKTHNDHATFFHGLAGDTTGEYIYYTADAKDHVFSTSNSERLRINSSGNVGISQTSPDTKLDVNGAFFLRPSTQTFPNENGAGLRLRSDTSRLQLRALQWTPSVVYYNIDYMGLEHRWDVNGAPKLKLDSSGNLLVGTETSNGAKFKVSDGGAHEFAFFPNDSGVNSLVNYNRSGGAYVDMSIAAREVSFSTGTSPNEAVRIDRDRKVLIGTNTAATNAEITLRATAPQLSLFATPGNVSRITLGDTDDWNIGQLGYDNSDNSMFFSTNNATRINVDSNGRIRLTSGGLSLPSAGEYQTPVFVILEGMTDPTANPGAALNSVIRTMDRGSNNNAYTGIEIRNRQSGDLRILNQDSGISNRATLNILQDTDLGGGGLENVLTISYLAAVYATGVYDHTTSGGANVNVVSGGQIRRSTSSIKYKTQVETLEDSYADALLNCRPVWYRSTCIGDNPNYSYWGLIAEEVAEIDPRLVHWSTTNIDYIDEIDEKGDTVYEEDGKTPKKVRVKTEEKEAHPEGVAYERFVPHLLNLIKRQQEAIQILETRVATLEAD